MKKYPIGFKAKLRDELEKEVLDTISEQTARPRKSVVQVYFPHRGMGWAYYNDSFDLKVGDMVYVEGKLEGYRGQVTEVNYSFKIKLSDYKKVIAVIDTNVAGDFYMAGANAVTFNKGAIPFSKVISWLKAPENEDEYETGDDDSKVFPLDDLSKMQISQETAERGYDYFLDNRVGFLELDGRKGRAIVEGSEIYEIEFDYDDGEISNIKCSCFCSGSCKHEFAALLELKAGLEFITENYEKEYNGYFAMIKKVILMNTVMRNNTSKKLKMFLAEEEQ